MWMKRLVVLNQVAVALGTLTRLLIRRSEPLTRRRVAESLLSWSLPLNLGVLETFFFVRHVLRDQGSAEETDDSTEDRVRSEVALAHLAFGVLGLLSVRFRGAFWSATVIGQAVFLIGVATVNVCEGLKNRMLWFDVLMSLAHLVLLKAYDPQGDAESRPLRRRLGFWLLEDR